MQFTEEEKKLIEKKMGSTGKCQRCCCFKHFIVEPQLIGNTHYLLVECPKCGETTFHSLGRLLGKEWRPQEETNKSNSKVKTWN